jgi:glycosyltransferase involved in cell wall biosynthesis
LIDSTRAPGRLHLGTRSSIHVIHSMAYATDYIHPGDILVVRGGFKPWYPLLDYIYKRRENWILFYRANTNRHPWPFWDITLNDLIDTPRAVRGRLQYNFSKPVNEDVFGIIDAPNTIPREYDVMVGASHIHRKKGQHLTVQALQQYYHMFGTKPHAIMPGGYVKGWHINTIKDILNSGDVDIEGPVNLPRPKLALAMNRTKLFVHPGYGGQNDRGILESMCCGCMPLVFGRSHMSPVIYDNAVHIPQDPANIATTIHQALGMVSEYDQTTYARINGLYEVAIPKMLEIIKFIENNPKPDRRAACERFIRS